MKRGRKWAKIDLSRGECVWEREWALALVQMMINSLYAVEYSNWNAIFTNVITQPLTS